MISISGYYLDPSGYGETTRRYTYALQQAGVDVVPGQPLTDGYGQMDPAETWKWAKLNEFIRKKGKPDTHFILAAAAQIPIVRDMVDAPRTVGFTAWETDRLPDSYVSGADELDGIVVPCNWNASVYQDRDIDAARVLIPAIKPERPEVLPQARLSLRKHFGIKESSYVFYSIGTWQPRKNFEGLVTAYLRAFTGYDDVALVLKITGGTADIEAAKQAATSLRKIANIPNPPKIIVDGGRNMTDEVLWGLHAAGDCYVSMTRGEACGIPMMDAAVMGKRVIATSEGGHVDYLESYPGFFGVECNRAPVMQDYVFFSANQCWYEPLVLSCSKLMKTAVQDGPVVLTWDMRHLDPKTIGHQLAEVLYGH